MKEALQIAIEQGYQAPNNEPFLSVSFRKFGRTTSERMYISYILMDPEFWKHIGKGWGWKGDEWIKQWQKYIKYRAKGGSSMDFFKKFTQ